MLGLQKKNHAASIPAGETIRRRESYMEQAKGGQILIECPNTIFHLYARNEGEISKIQIFVNNIRAVKRLGLNDIYNWCNRQGIVYRTRFNYHREISLWDNVKSYCLYTTQKLRYQFAG